MSIELQGAGYRYNGGFTLEPVTFTVPKGSFTVLIGPNGSGKSTLFSLMGGRLKPHSGKILLDGTLLSSLSPRQRARRLGLVPQISERTFDYTVREMVRMGRFPHQPLFGGDTAEDKRMVEGILERLDLKHLARRSVRALSGGEYQRVLLGRVLAQEPDILLLDEPGNHLDLRHQASFLSLLKQETNRGKTVIAVLHDLNQALQYGEQGLLLDQGRPLAWGDPGEFLTIEKVEQVYGVRLESFWNEDGSRRILGLPKS